MSDEAGDLIPLAIRIAVRNAVGGWGPYTAREIDDLFNGNGFTDFDRDVPDAGGVRRTAAEAYHARINFRSADESRRYLELVDEVLQNYPEDSSDRNSPGERLRLALRRAHISRGQGGHFELAGTGASVAAALDEATYNLWTPERIRVFISHTSGHRAEVGRLATELNRFAFSCFVAHDAIEPSREWQDVIEQALRSCDVLVAYVTPDFSNSRWTDQEVGWALGRDLVILPLKVGADPYGFFGSYQALPVDPSQPARQIAVVVSRSISLAILGVQRPGANRLIPRMADLVVEAFCTSRSFATTERRFELLRYIPKTAWTDAHVARLQSALSDNAQIRNCVVQLGTPMNAPEAIAQLLDRMGRSITLGSFAEKR
jgi:hypothetical protein